MNIFEQIRSFLKSPDPSHHPLQSPHMLDAVKTLANAAFIHKDKDALLEAHRSLYLINLAHLDVAWETPVNHVAHPVIAHIKYQLETVWEQEEHQKYQPLLDQLPAIEHFTDWVKKQVAQHASNELHPVFLFLRHEATLAQMRAFFFQETPLEMLFGDIIAMMLPGVYGSIKVEFLKNYWDEVGKANDARVHRNLRGNLMTYLKIPTDCYHQTIELFLCEELALINMYLSLATNRAKHTELVGVMLATELMIPNRFQYSIDGFRRLGLDNEVMTYLIEHTSIDEVHAEDWLMHVVLPILTKHPETMRDLVCGIFRRLDTSVAVLDQLHASILDVKKANL